MAAPETPWTGSAPGAKKRRAASSGSRSTRSCRRRPRAPGELIRQAAAWRPSGSACQRALAADAEGAGSVRPKPMRTGPDSDCASASRADSCSLNDGSAIGAAALAGRAGGCRSAAWRADAGMTSAPMASAADATTGDAAIRAMAVSSARRNARRRVRARSAQRSASGSVLIGMEDIWRFCMKRHDPLSTGIQRPKKECV